MDKAAYFISDLHLGAKYRDNSSERERRAVRFLREIKDKASELYLVGDILDYWYEYRTVVPRGYVRFFGALAELADAGVKITWFIGNHDIWLFDYLRDEIGLEVVDGSKTVEIGGRRFFISHGDGLGHLDAGFRFIRGMFRNRVCQKLYSAIHPRWTIPFAHRWSSHSRMNDSDEAIVTPQDDPLINFAREYLESHPSINYFIFGHRHVELCEKISDDCEVVILGDWLDKFTYGIFDGKSFELRRYNP